MSEASQEMLPQVNAVRDPVYNSLLESSVSISTHFTRIASYNVTKSASKIIHYALQKSKKDGHDFEYVSIPVSEFLSTLNTKSNNAYKTIRETVDALSDSRVGVVGNKVDGRVLVGRLPWFSSIFYDSGAPGKSESVIHFKFNQDLKALLQGKQFTQYHLLYIFNFKCSYSERLYLLLRGFDHKKDTGEPVDFTLAQFRESLDLTTKGYDKYSNIKNRVLIPAMRDINKITELKVSLVEHLGRYNKVTRLDFLLESQVPELERLIEESRKNSKKGLPADYQMQEKLLKEALGEERFKNILNDSTEQMSFGDEAGDA